MTRRTLEEDRDYDPYRPRARYSQKEHRDRKALRKDADATKDFITYIGWEADRDQALKLSRMLP